MLFCPLIGNLLLTTATNIRMILPHTHRVAGLESGFV